MSVASFRLQEKVAQIRFFFFFTCVTDIDCIYRWKTKYLGYRSYRPEILTVGDVNK